MSAKRGVRRGWWKGGEHRFELSNNWLKCFRYQNLTLPKLTLCRVTWNLLNFFTTFFPFKINRRTSWQISPVCCVSGSVESICFWASRAVIICTDPDLDWIQILPSTSKKVRKPSFLPIFNFFGFFISEDLCTVNLPSKSNMQNKYENIIFLASCQPQTKKAGSVSGSVISVVRIRKSRSVPKCHGSTTFHGFHGKPLNKATFSAVRGCNRE